MTTRENAIFLACAGTSWAEAASDPSAKGQWGGDREAADRDYHLFIIYIYIYKSSICIFIYISTSREQGNIACRCAKVIVKQLTERFNGTMKSLASQGETTIELSEKYNTLHIFLTFPFTLSISSKKKNYIINVKRIKYFTRRAVQRSAFVQGFWGIPVQNPARNPGSSSRTSCQSIIKVTDNWVFSWTFLKK